MIRRKHARNEQDNVPQFIYRTLPDVIYRGFLRLEGEMLVKVRSKAVSRSRIHEWIGEQIGMTFIILCRRPL